MARERDRSIGEAVPAEAQGAPPASPPPPPAAPVKQKPKNSPDIRLISLIDQKFQAVPLAKRVATLEFLLASYRGELEEQQKAAGT